MSKPTVQCFFETPLIELTLDSAEPEAISAAALALARRYTTDVSQPTAPRFAWGAEGREVVLAPGESHAPTTSPGDFWVAACCLDPGDGAGGLSIEDPRHATAAAGVPGLDVADETPVVTILPVAGGLAMFQAFVRHGLRNDGAVPQRWLMLGLRARQL